MKFIFLSILCTASLSHANIPDLPNGSYPFQDAEFVSTQHKKIVYTRTSSGKDTYDKLRSQGYSCSRKPNYFVLCRKKIETNPDNIKYDSKHLRKLSPDFGKIIAFELINESESVDKYHVSQEVSFDEFTTRSYIAYINKLRNLTYLDLELPQSETIRFIFNGQSLNRISFQKQKLGKKDDLIHTLKSTYIK